MRSGKAVAMPRKSARRKVCVYVFIVHCEEVEMNETIFGDIKQCAWRGS